MKMMDYDFLPDYIRQVNRSLQLSHRLSCLRLPFRDQWQHPLHSSGTVVSSIPCTVLVTSISQVPCDTCYSGSGLAEDSPPPTDSVVMYRRV